MRRIAMGLAMLAVACGCGCQQITAPWSPPVAIAPEHPLEEPEIRTKTDAVSDEVMLGDRTRGGFVDSPSGP